MKWLIVTAGVPALVILALLVLGLLQPVRHSITRSIRLKQSPETVFAAIDGFETMSNSSTVLKVERLPDRDGKPVALVTLKWGHLRMVMTQLERRPPSRMVVRMTREEGRELGTWTYQITRENDGCRLALTEEGEMKNPFFRAIGRMRGLDANLKQSLAELAGKFGQTAEIQTVP
jgi:hypothetical protein